MVNSVILFFVYVFWFFEWRSWEWDLFILEEVRVREVMWLIIDEWVVIN